MPAPVLNWRELALVIEQLKPRVEGLFVDRILVPDRPFFPQGYVKGEWAIRLTSRKQEETLIFSVRPRHPYVILAQGKGPKAAPLGTHAALDLALSKQIRGSRLLSIEALPRERAVLLRFSSEGEKSLGLVLWMIPATPEALLIDDDKRVLASSRPGASKPVFVFPDGSQAPAEPPVREEVAAGRFAELVERSLRDEAFELRKKEVERAFRERQKHSRERAKQSETALAEARKESDWLRYGTLLRGVLDDPPPLVGGVRQVMDYETGEYADVPCDPKLGASEQAEKFFQLERRKKRRIEEAAARAETLRETEAQATARLAELEQAREWETLRKLEQAAGIQLEQARPQPGAKPSKKTGAWLGRSFVSKNGLPIWVGKTRDENLELTFKHARGNDLWLHVRGRPGAHVVVPVPSGKSAPLDTLLDAAVLAVYFSGGESWGKTEVDYTFRKNVKRIKNSTEVSYTGNKTLIVLPEQERLKRLLKS